MNKSVIRITLGLGLIALTACGSKNAPTVEALSSQDLSASAIEQNIELPQANGHASKIIGASDLIKVRADGANIDANLRTKLDAFGAVAISQTAANGGGGTCTGTHIGNGYVITAGHCFFNESTPGNLVEANKPCPELKVYWGYRGSPDTGSAQPVVSLISQCTKVIYAERSNDRDFGVFKVDKMPAASIAISTDSARTAANTKITLFGYPQARPLEWSQYCPLKKTITPAGVISSAQFAYQCDSEPGNSGSSVLAISSTGAIKVVGIHDAAAPDGVDYNLATYMFDIRKVMLTKGINLDQLTRSN